MDINVVTYLKLKNEYEKSAKELSSFIQNNKKVLLNSVCDELKKISGMNKIVVKGYTPGFNDGEPCTHSSETYYNKRYDFGELAEYEIYGLAEFLNAPRNFIDEELYEWEEINNVNTYSDEDEEKVQELCNILDYIIEQIYDTNYIVFVDLTLDEDFIKVEDYDCGY